MDIDPVLRVTHPDFLGLIFQLGTPAEVEAATFLQNIRSYYNLWNCNQQINIPDPKSKNLPNPTTSPQLIPDNPINHIQDQHIYGNNIQDNTQDDTNNIQDDMWDHMMFNDIWDDTQNFFQNMQVDTQNNEQDEQQDNNGRDE